MLTEINTFLTENIKQRVSSSEFKDLQSVMNCVAQSCISPYTLNKVVDVINTNVKNADDRCEKLNEGLHHMHSKFQRTKELCSYLSTSLNEINDLFQTSVQNMICDKIGLLARIENIS